MGENKSAKTRKRKRAPRQKSKMAPAPGEDLEEDRKRREGFELLKNKITANPFYYRTKYARALGRPYIRPEDFACRCAPNLITYVPICEGRKPDCRLWREQPGDG